MNEDEPIFIDAESEYQNEKTNSFKDIIMNHLAKISNISTKEFYAGYWKKKPVATSGGVYMTEVYVEDTRDAYINAIDFFHDILLPKFDPDATDKIKAILDKAEDKKKELEGKQKEWKDFKLTNRREIFQELSKLLKRLKYLNTGSIDG